MNNRFIQTNSNHFEKDVLKNELPVLVYFYSDECAPCVALGPILDRMVEQYGESMKFVKIYRQHNRDLAEKYNIKSSPTLLFIKDGEEVCSRLNGYISRPELKEVIEGVIGGSCIRRERQKVYCDILILGGGPAGLSAAIYAARAKLFTVVVDEGPIGGQVATTYHVANYPGTNGVIRGMDLTENMKKQALEFGAQIDDMKELVELRLDGREKYIKTEDTDYFTKAVVVATGAQPRKLPAEGEREFRGRGVHYCATCDGALYQDADVLVIGGGNSAVEEAIFLTRYVKHVTILHQFDHFQSSKAAQDEALHNPNISVVWDTEVRKINGENFVKSVTVENLKTREVKEMETEGVFVYIGMQPKTDLFKGKLELDQYGYIIADEDMKTSVPGVYVAGDVRVKKIRQIATAVGDGVIAGIMAERYINGK
jgi:thioredoxin reductase (NADPH)